MLKYVKIIRSINILGRHFKMAKNKLVAPVLKWVGGKRQLLDTLKPLFPKGYKSYCEPFIGGGAVLFSIQPKNAYVNDINAELINVYNVIQNDVDELIELLKLMKNDSKFFYEIRDWDRDREKYQSLSEVQKAARIIYLNKTCYNGLYRVNNAGEFNSPFGSYKNPNIVNEPVLRAVSNYFNKANIHFTTGDYSLVLKNITKGTFVYLDPPYDPISTSSNFTGYSRGGFGREEQIRLKAFCDKLDSRGIKFMLSNSATEFILDQYQNYKITRVQAKRSINSVGSKRGNVDEVVVTNYER
jgi:DNA adenine methylase